MSQLTGLFLFGALAFVVAGAGFALVQPRRFTDRDADGEPDATLAEIEKSRPKAKDGIDEIAERRARRGAG